MARIAVVGQAAMNGQRTFATEVATERGSRVWDEVGCGTFRNPKPRAMRAFLGPSGMHWDGRDRISRPVPRPLVIGIDRHLVFGPGLRSRPTCTPTGFLAAEAPPLGLEQMVQLRSARRAQALASSGGSPGRRATGRNGRSAARSCACRSGQSRRDRVSGIANAARVACRITAFPGVGGQRTRF